MIGRILLLILFGITLVACSTSYSPEKTVQTYEFESGAIAIINTGFLKEDGFVKDGISLTFYPNGVPETLVETSGDIWNGNYYKWNNLGNLEAYRYYKDGKILIEKAELQDVEISDGNIKLNPVK